MAVGFYNTRLLKKNNPFSLYESLSEATVNTSSSMHKPANWFLCMKMFTPILGMCTDNNIYLIVSDNDVFT